MLNKIKAKHKLIPVILAGGSGSRLWPLSRSNEPKPFIKLLGDKSLFEITLKRARSINPECQIVVIRDELFFMAKEQAKGIDNGIHYILEPIGKNTAPAIFMAAQYIKLHFGENFQMLVMPSDHILDEGRRYESAIKKATKIASKNQIVVFGVKPTSPKIGYGYIQSDEKLNKVISFKEKPNLKTAIQYLKKDNYYWNSGIFLFDVKILISAFKLHAPSLYKNLSRVSLNQKSPSLAIIDLVSYKSVKDISFDYAVLEHVKNLSCVKANFFWDDVGDWTTVSNFKNKKNKNQIYNEGSLNTYIHSNNPEKVIAIIDADDLIVVDSDDALLISHKNSTQKVKLIPEKLKLKNDTRAFDNSTVKRPWGFYKVLIETKTFKVKKIFINPYSSISLQSHSKRNEHWIVVSGTASVVNGNNKLILKTNESTYVKAKIKHQLRNDTYKPLIIIEVQCGKYLGEDDIKRFADDYGRH
jgi:mannose-1-phosphate guanylyltransferase/mannose-6-phosphate isomerase